MEKHASVITIRSYASSSKHSGALSGASSSTATAAAVRARAKAEAPKMRLMYAEQAPNEKGESSAGSFDGDAGHREGNRFICGKDGGVRGRSHCQ